MDPFFHRDLTLRVGDRRLSLAVSQELFSSHTIDTGTLMLIRSLERLDAREVLDLGCGYGPLALAAKVRLPDARVEAVDRDALALEYTTANAERHGLDVAVHGSLGGDDVEGSFDLVVCNVPGKGAPAFHRDLLDQLAARLGPDGVLAVVVVNPLVPAVEEFLDVAGGDELHRDVGREHTVLHVRPATRVARHAQFDRGAYDRAEVVLQIGKRSVPVATVHGLTEFDALGFHTELARRVLPVVAGADLAVVNPGQGHVAVHAAVAGGLSSIQLVDRDLLALRTTARNLAAIGVTAVTRHDWRPVVEPIDLAVLNVRAKEPAAVHIIQRDALLDALRPGGQLVVAGTATAVDRVTRGMKVRAQDRRRGFAATRLQKSA